MTEMELVLERFDEGMERMLEDPEAFRQEIEAELVAEKGQAWLDEHRDQFDAQWEFASQLMGL